MWGLTALSKLSPRPDNPVLQEGPALAAKSIFSRITNSSVTLVHLKEDW